MTQSELKEKSERWNWYFFGYDQYIVFRTKREAKEYLKNNPSIYRIGDLKSFTYESIEKFLQHDTTKIFETIDNVAVPLEIVHIADEAISEQIETLQEFNESLIQWFVRVVPSFTSGVFCATCSNCFTLPSTICVVTDHGTPFEFCRSCYDELKGAYLSQDHGLRYTRLDQREMPDGV